MMNRRIANKQAKAKTEEIDKSVPSVPKESAPKEAINNGGLAGESKETGKIEEVEVEEEKKQNVVPAGGSKESKESKAKAKVVPITKPKIKPKAKKKATAGGKTAKRAKPKKKTPEKDALQYLDAFLKSGREEDINKLFANLPITIKKWMKEDPQHLSGEYKALLEIVIKNIPSLLSNIENINKSIDPTTLSDGINKTIKTIIGELPKFTLRLLLSPGGTVDASLSVAIYTVLYLLEGMQKFMTSMMDSTMASAGAKQRQTTTRARY